MIGTLVAAKRRVRYKNLRPGLFTWLNELCLMTEYGREAYIVSSGEAFWGQVQTPNQRDELMVTPITVEPVG